VRQAVVAEWKVRVDGVLALGLAVGVLLFLCSLAELSTQVVFGLTSPPVLAACVAPFPCPVRFSKLFCVSTGQARRNGRRLRFHVVHGDGERVPQVEGGGTAQRQVSVNTSPTHYCAD
jgi:hypothetical protein